MAQIVDAIKLLSSHSGVASLICNAVLQGKIGGMHDVRKLCTICGIAQSCAGDVVNFLSKAKTLGLVRQVSELNWQIADVSAMRELAPMFQAIHIYRQQVHQDENTVEVVLTRPPNPSALSKALEQMLLGTWGLLDTRDILPSIAEKAKERFVVMTPFLDQFGGQVLVDLYQNVAKGAGKQLILRMTPDGQLPAGYLSEAKKLKELGVEVYNFRLERVEEAGTETFHAKVLLADHQCAYVGSTNMNRWSFQYSLELGLMVSGNAAVRIGHIVDAIIKVSSRIS